MTTAQGVTALLGAALQNDAAFRETMAAHAENPANTEAAPNQAMMSRSSEPESPPSKPEARKRAQAEKGSALRPSRRGNQPKRFEAGAAKSLQQAIQQSYSCEIRAAESQLQSGSAGESI